MKAIEFKKQNCVYAKDQKDYQPLPALKIESNISEVITCWKVNFWEKIVIMFTGRIFLSMWTFNKPLMPVFISVDENKTIEKAIETAKQNPVSKTSSDVKDVIKNASNEDLKNTLSGLRRQAIFIEDEMKSRSAKKLKLI